MEDIQLASVQSTPMLGRVAAIASLICALECAAMPFVIALLPMIGLSGELGELLGLGILIFVFFVAGGNTLYGYRARHRNPYPLAIFALGFSLLLIGRFVIGEESMFGTVASVFGALTVGGAQLYNNRLVCACCVPQFTEGKNG